MPLCCFTFLSLIDIILVDQERFSFFRVDHGVQKLQPNSDESQSHQPLNYHNNAWPNGLAGPPSIVVGRQQVLEVRITHVGYDCLVIFAVQYETFLREYVSSGAVKGFSRIFG
jgi:hypothetical protein